MKSSMGTNLIITLFGKSHGKLVGAVLDGLAAGIKINEIGRASCRERV